MSEPLWLPQALASSRTDRSHSLGSRKEQTHAVLSTARCVHGPRGWGWGWGVGEWGGTAPLACLPDAVLAEVVIVAEDDDFAWHGGTDAEAILDLEGHRGRVGARKTNVTIMNYSSAQN